MPVFTVSSAKPRQELAMAIVEGEGSVDGLIGKKAMPDFPINRRTAHLIKATLADTQALRVIDAAKYERAPGTKFERMVAKFGDDTISVTLRGLEVVVPNEVNLDYAEYLDVESFFASRFGNETSALTKEKLIAAQVFNTANTVSGSATNSTIAYTAANLATISFIGDVIASIRRVKAQGEVPDTVLMSGPVYERVRQATLVQNYVRGTLYAGADTNETTLLAALASYGIKQILIGDSYYNTAADGASPSLTQIWSNTYVAVFKAGKAGSNDTAGVGVPTLGGFGVNAFWEGFNNGGTPSTDRDTMSFAGGNYVESYPDLTIDSMIVRVKMSSLPYVANKRVMDLVATQYS